MQSKLLLYIALFSLLLFTVPLYAQDQEEEVPESVTSQADQELTDNEKAEAQWQSLEWEVDNPVFVLKYLVVIEEKDSKTGEWNEVRRIFTPDNIPSVDIEPRLPMGIYRFKVITYDLLGLDDIQSDWCEFKIYSAFTPRVAGVNVNVNKSNTIYFDEFNDGMITISGRHLFGVKKSEDEMTFTEYSLENIKNLVTIPIQPVEIKDNKEAVFQVDLNTLEIGKYHFVATDASGLKSRVDNSNELVIKFKKIFDMDLSAGYQLPVILFDSTMEEYMGSAVWPVSVMGKATFIPVKRRIGYFGLGFEGFYTRMDAESKAYAIEGNIASLYANFVYQYHIINRKNNRHIAAFELHGGIGAEYLLNFKFHFDHGIESTPLNSLNPGIAAGGAVQVYVGPRMFIEINADMCVSLFSDMSMGVFRPGVLVGWQF